MSCYADRHMTLILEPIQSTFCTQPYLHDSNQLDRQNQVLNSAGIFNQILIQSACQVIPSSGLRL